jgi:hypothetical protein
MNPVNILGAVSDTVIDGAIIDNAPRGTITNASRRAINIGDNIYSQQDTWTDVTIKNVDIVGVRPNNQATTYAGIWATGVSYTAGQWLVWNDNPYRVLQDHISTTNPGVALAPNYATAQPVTNGICLFGKNFIVQDVSITDVARSVSDCEGYYQKARFSVLERATLLNAGSHQASVAYKGNDPGDTDSPQGYDNDCINVFTEFTDAHNALCATFGTKTSGFFAQNSQLRFETIRCKRANEYAVYSSIRKHNALEYTGVTVQEHLGHTAVAFLHSGTGLIVDGLTLDFDSSVTGVTYGVVVSPTVNPNVAAPYSLNNVSLKNITGEATVGVVLQGELGNVTLEDISLPIVVTTSCRIESLTLTNCAPPAVLGSVSTLTRNGVVYPGFTAPNAATRLVRNRTLSNRKGNRVSL